MNALSKREQYHKIVVGRVMNINADSKNRPMQRVISVRLTGAFNR